MNNLLITKKEYFTKIYRENVDDVFRFIMSKTYNKELSEEIVSDTFYILIDQLDSLDESKGKIKTYIFGIALNKLRQKWDKNKSIRFLSLDEDIHIEEKYIPSLKRKNLFKTIISVMETLPNKYKDVLSKRFLEYKNIKDVAEELKISNSNVTTIQNRGLQKIKKIINEQKSK